MRKQVHKKTVIRDGKEETIVTEDTHVEQDNEVGEFSLLLRPIGESDAHEEWLSFPAHRSRISKFLSRSREMKIG